MPEKNETPDTEQTVADVKTDPEQETNDFETKNIDEAIAEAKKRVDEQVHGVMKSLKILGPDETIQYEGLEDPENKQKAQLRCGETLFVTKKTGGIGNSQLQRCIAVGMLDEETGQRHDCLVPLYRINDGIMFQDKPELICHDEQGQLIRNEQNQTVMLPMLYGNVALGTYWMDTVFVIQFSEVLDAAVYKLYPDVEADSEKAKAMSKEELDQLLKHGRNHRAQCLNHVYSVMKFLKETSPQEQMRLEQLAITFRALAAAGQ